MLNSPSNLVPFLNPNIFFKSAKMIFYFMKVLYSIEKIHTFFTIWNTWGFQRTKLTTVLTSLLGNFIQPLPFYRSLHIFFFSLFFGMRNMLGLKATRQILFKSWLRYPLLRKPIYFKITWRTIVAMVLSVAILRLSGWLPTILSLG